MALSDDSLQFQVVEDVQEEKITLSPEDSQEYIITEPSEDVPEPKAHKVMVGKLSRKS